MLIYFISRLYKVLSWEVIVINWIDIINIIFKKGIILRSYPNIHLHISYVRSFQEICIYSDRPTHPNRRQWPLTGHYLQSWIVCNLMTAKLTAQKMIKDFFSKYDQIRRADADGSFLVTLNAALLFPQWKFHLPWVALYFLFAYSAILVEVLRLVAAASFFLIAADELVCIIDIHSCLAFQLFSIRKMIKICLDISNIT